MQPGDKITSSVTYNKAANSYTMIITSSQLGKSISTDYALLSRQSAPESSAVFVLEHQPERCNAYPTSGEMSFENIYIEVGGKAVSSPEWRSLQERPACDSKAVIVDDRTIKFTWDTKTQAPPVEEMTAAPAKWGSSEPPRESAA